MGGVRDGYSNFKFFEVIGPRSAAGTQLTGIAVDTRGFETVTFVFGINLDVSGTVSGAHGAETSQYFMRMQHGVSNAAGTVVYSNCQASHMLFDMTFGGAFSDVSVTSYGWLQTNSTGSGINEGICAHFGIVAAASFANIESQPWAAGYIGTRRWARLMFSCSAVGDVSAVGVYAIAICGLPGQWPVNLIKRTVDEGVTGL